MARESTIQVLYGNAATTAPTDLSDGEFAFAHGNDKLFIGANGNNTAVWVGAEILDEDTFSSNSDTNLATQQSIKAYVDAQIGASAGVVSIEGLNGAILLDANTGITLATSGGDTITFSGTNATTSAKGVASFAAADFSVSSGVVSLEDSVVKNVYVDDGLLTPLGHTFGIIGGEGISVTHTFNEITIDGTDATTSEKGIASFTSADFSVASGAVSLGDDVVKDITTDSGALTPSGHRFSILGGNSIDVTHTGITMTVAVENLGIDTAQLATGAVTKTKIGADAVDGTKIEDDAINSEHIVDGAVDNVHLANSTITIEGDSGSQAVSLGKNIDIAGGTNITTSTAIGIDPVQARVTINLDDNITLSGGITAADLVVTNGIANSELQNSSVTVNAGDGLLTTSSSISLGSSATLSVDVDDATIEIKSNELAVKDGGITNAKLANSSFVISDGAGNTSDISLGNTLTLQGTTNEVTVAESAGTVTIGLPDDVTIAGNLTVNGTVTTIDTVNLVVEDPLIKLAKNNNSDDNVDIGFYGLYDTSGSQDLYAGLFRDQSDDKFRLFTSLQVEPTTTVNTGGAGYAVGTLVANISGGSF